MTQNSNIIIDMTPAVNCIRAIQRYCQHLTVEIDGVDSDLDFTLLYMGIKDRTLLPSLKSNNIHQVSSSIPGKLLNISWKLFNAPTVSHWIKDPFELIHFPGGLPYIPTNCQNVLTTLHGFASKFIPEHIDQKIVTQSNKNLDIAISKSTHFITVSETNKKEAIKLWGIAPEKITAIPLGVSPEFQVYNLSNETNSEITQKYALPDKPFILFVGALEPHKNIKNIIIAYSQLPSPLRKKYQLVLVGKNTPYSKEYKEQILSLGLSDNVSFIDYIQPGSLDLAYLYNMAKIFVFPTFYEGWASPPLEAMKCGTPAVVSDIPSLRESTGGISLYPKPEDPKEISNSILELLEDENFHLRQKQKGETFANNYTWKRCAEKTLALYEELIDE